MTSIIRASNTSGITFTSDTSGNVAITADGGLILANASIGGFAVPTGTTAQRPASPAEGTLRYNSTLKITEIYTGNSTWEPITSSSYTYTSSSNSS
jgi:hypothetical protein